VTAPLEVKDLCFSYDSRPALEGINFTVRPGERVGLAGANGSGKSTLVWCILGLLRCGGSVRLFGGRPGGGVLARVGVVFQNPEDQLFLPSILDDVALPLINRGELRTAAHARARATLAAVGLAGCESRPAAALSLGQRKRAAIAAALIDAPALLLLDEPTAELDGRSVRQLKELLLGLDAAMLIASHDLSFLRDIASRAVVLGEGRILRDGPAGPVLGDSALLVEAGLI
jgi:energy-coupling factor transporter ATP-binding protein EcfA2